ncbi:MAG: SAM-dependent methyltransferase [Ignavibacteria bacterium]|nr:SAM-dependent methyltransferase [Ignavibacteria bacterium]
MINLFPIGKVVNNREEIEDDYWGNTLSAIILDDSIDSSSLKGIEEFSHLEIIFHFDKADDNKIVTGARHPRNLEHLPETGIFAQRGKNRPNKLGLTIVKLIKAEGKTLIVEGLDAINGSPVLDIKPVYKEFLPSEEIRQPEWIKEIMKDYWK